MPAQEPPVKPSPWTPPTTLPDNVVTPRLVIRFWQPEDAGRMLAALDAGRESFLPWLSWQMTDNRTEAECVYQIEKARRARERAEPTPDNFVIGLFDRATVEAVGGLGFHRLNLGTHEAEIGYWVRADRRGQGLCTEAVVHLISSGFKPQAEGGWGFRRIHIRCSGDNSASAGVLRKLKIREEGRLTRDHWVDGLGWQDTLVFGVLVSEWDTSVHRTNDSALIR